MIVFVFVFVFCCCLPHSSYSPSGLCLKNKQKKLHSFHEVFGGTEVFTLPSLPRRLFALQPALPWILPPLPHCSCPWTGHAQVLIVRSFGHFSLFISLDFSAAFDVNVTAPSFSKWFPPFALKTLQCPGFFLITGPSFPSSQPIPFHIQPLKNAVPQLSCGALPPPSLSLVGISQSMTLNAIPVLVTPAEISPFSCRFIQSSHLISLGTL